MEDYAKLGRIVRTPFHFIVIPFFPSANKRFGAHVYRGTREYREKFRLDGS